MPLEKPESAQDTERLIENLRAILAKLEVALGATHDCIAWTDERGRIEWCNAPFDRLVGLPHMGVLGQDIVKTLPFELPAGRTHPAKTVLSSRSFITETIPVRDGKTTRHFEFFGSWAQGGGVKPIAVFVVRDVTARVAREEQLRRTTAIVQAQQESTLDGVLIVDEHGRIVHFNKRFGDIWETPMELLRQPFPQRTDAFLQQLADPHGFIDRIQHLYANREETGHDELRLKDGRVIDRYSAPITGPDGTYYGRAWYFRDVTERKRSEAALEAKSRELERSNSELQQFASAASHDLMEPLRKVTAFGDLLRKRIEDKLDPTSREFLDRMQNACVRMSKLIEDLLQFSRVFGDTRPFQEVDLRVVALDVAADLEVAIKRAGGSVEVGDLPTINAHPFQMRQLLQNLIANALKFRRADAPPRVTLTPRTSASNGFIEIEIRDNGIGFENRFADEIFQPFLRLHTRSEYEGTGLGLAICRRIAMRHGGWINAQGEPGQGSVFIVTLPVGGKR